MGVGFGEGGVVEGEDHGDSAAEVVGFGVDGRDTFDHLKTEGGFCDAVEEGGGDAETLFDVSIVPKKKSNSDLQMNPKTPRVCHDTVGT